MALKFNIRKRYANGKDFYVEDCDTLAGAKFLAREESKHFRFGAVYVRGIGEGGVKQVVACYANGVESAWAWWNKVAT